MVGPHHQLYKASVNKVLTDRRSNQRFPNKMAAVDVFVDLTHDPLNTDAIISRVNCPQCGAVSVFLGVTRDHHDGQQVLRLEYECYESMARSQLAEIGHEAAAKWPSVRKVALVHRLGLVPVGEASVVVAVSSPHRREAMEACGFAIDTLKAKVAIWKKEVYQSGDAQWKANPECSWANPTVAPPSS